jgi:hypothetical protein
MAILDQAAKKFLKNQYKNNPVAPTGSFKNLSGRTVSTATSTATSTAGEGYRALDNIITGLQSNFKNADMGVIQSHADNIYKNLNDNMISRIAQDKDLFGNMIGQDTKRLGKFGDDIDGYVKNASNNRGWMGSTPARGANFYNLEDAAVSAEVQNEKRRIEKYAAFKQEANRRNDAYYSADTFRKQDLVATNRTMQDIRTQSPDISAAEVRDALVHQRGANPDFANQSSFVRKAQTTDSVYEQRAFQNIANRTDFEKLADGDIQALVAQEKRDLREQASKQAAERSKAQAQQQAQAAQNAQQEAINVAEETPTVKGESASPKVSGTVDKYMQRRYGTMVDDISSALNSGQKLNSDTINSFAQQTRLNDEVSAQFKSMIEGGKNAEAIALLKSQQQNYISSANIMDKAYAHKIPQKGAVVVGGAWLVNNMSASRGQQSNSQLYGQQTPYM